MNLNPLPDGRVPLPAGTIVQLGGNSYKINTLIGYGGGSLVYDADDLQTASRHVALKEIFPSKGCSRDKSSMAITPSSSAGETALELVKNTLANQEICLGNQADFTNYQVTAFTQAFYEAYIQTPDSLAAQSQIEQSVCNTYALGKNLQEKGSSLANFAQAHGSFTLAEALQIMKSVCSAYAQLHTDAILHGDISLGNIFYQQHDHERGTCNGQAAIIDFGQAKKLEEDTEDGLWKSKAIPANCPIPSTPGFTPPETLAREDAIRLTPAADVYGLTVLFAILLLGRQPGWLIRISMQESLDCNEAMIDAVNDVIVRGTCFKPEERYQNAGELLAALQGLEDALNRRSAEDGSVSPITLHHGMMAYLEKHEHLFPTEHDPKLASVLKDLGATRLNIYGRLECSDEVRPIEDIFEECQRWEGNWEGSIYIYAPGGGGKTFALSRLLKDNIRNRTHVPLYLDMAAFNEEAFNAVRDDHDCVNRVIPYLLAHQYMASTCADESIDGIKHLLYDAQDCPILLLLDNLHKVPSGLKTQAISAINALRARLVVAGRDESPVSEDGNKLLIHNHVSLCALPEEEMRRILERCNLDSVVYLGQTLEKRWEVLGLPMFFMRYLELTVSARNASGYSLDEVTAARIFYDYFNAWLASKSTSEVSPSDYSWLLYYVIPRLAYQKLVKSDYSEILRAYPKAKLDELGVLELVDGQCVFSHDLYEVYFASFYIASQLRKALAGDFSGLKEINHEWDYELGDCWPALLELLMDKQLLDYQALCGMLERQKCYLALGGAAIAWTEIWDQEHFQIGYDITGINFDQNILRALKKAAAKKHRRAAFHLALIAMSLSNRKEELRWHKKSWKLGQPTAAANIAEVYRWKHLYASNPRKLRLRYYDRKRLYWLKKGADQGNPLTMIRLGDYYQEKGNEQKARLWYRNAHIKGAEMGIAKHLFEMGKIYWTGDLTEKDPEKAIQCFYKAAQDYEYSALCWLYLGDIYSSPEKKDDAKAFIFYKQAAMKGNPTAINKVGLAHFYIWDTCYKEKKAAQWFRKGMDKGGPGSTSNLAYCYAHGIGVERSFSAALECYASAVELDEWPALVALAKYYAFGKECDRDIDKAVGYLERAANQRITIAQRALAYIYAFVNDDLEAAQFFYSCPLKPYDDDPDNTFIEKDSPELGSDELVDEFVEWLLGLGITLGTEEILEKARAFGMEDANGLAAKLQNMQG